MQLYLSIPTRIHVSDCAVIEFTGSHLRTYFHDSMVASIDAAPGECYYVQAHGQNKQPSITKAEMPLARGKKIAWALDFVQSKKHAESYQDFMERYQQIADSNGSENIFFEILPSYYAFMLGEKKTKNGIKKQPLFIWVADDISEKGLDSLIAAYKRYRRINCGERFLRVL